MRKIIRVFPIAGRKNVRYEKYNLFHGRLKIQKIFVTNLCGFGHNRIEGTVKGGGMQNNLCNPEFIQYFYTAEMIQFH